MADSLRIFTVYATVFFGLWTVIAVFSSYWYIYFLLWPALSMTVVMVVYLMDRPTLLGKNPATGQISYYRLVPMLPFFMLVWGIWFFRKRGIECYTKIADGIYLGRFTTMGEGIKKCKDTMVIDFTSEFSEPACITTVCNYRCILILDSFWARHKETVCDLLRDAAEWKGDVFVHCAYGQGRSAAFVVLLLLATGKCKNSEEAIKLLKKVRPTVDLNEEQREGIKECISLWEKQNTELTV